MGKTITNKELHSLLKSVQAQLAGLAERVAKLEGGAAVAGSMVPLSATAVPAAGKQATPPLETKSAQKQPEAISQEHLMAISAAISAFLGLRARVRQVRLISSRAWALEGRVSVQASHRPRS